MSLTIAALLLTLPPSVAPEPEEAADKTRKAVDHALHWLAENQSKDGSWDVQEGVARNRVGVSALALLALIGDGHTTQTGEHAEAVERGVRWLLGEQDPDTGLIGAPVGHTHHYDHGIATLALCRELVASGSTSNRAAIQRAVDYIHRSRNPYGAWRYDNPPIGDNDTSITGWMVAALAAAREAGLKTDQAAFHGAINWVQ